MIFETVILLGSLALILQAGIWGFVYTVVEILVSYAAGLLSRRWKDAPAAAILLNVIALTALKLGPLAGWEFPAVIGVSYFTLQVISYLADLIAGRTEPETDLFRYALYVAYYPHLLVGPIERKDSFVRSLEQRRITSEGITGGLLRVLWGAFKKLVLSSRAAVLVNGISGAEQDLTGGFVLAAVFLYSLQLYADFSGGVDMVLGVSRMLGFRMSENFDRPYFSETVAEFWRRWHMTLGNFLRDYVYIPLGGNRKGKVRKYLNTLITFMVSGIWHGAEYLLWGLFNGILVCTGNLFKTKSRRFNRVLTFLLISLLWVFFVWTDPLTALRKLGSVFTVFNYGQVLTALPQLGLSAAEGIVLAVSTVLLFLSDLCRERVTERVEGWSVPVRTAVLCLMVLMVALLGRYGIGFDSQAFIYSKF